MFCVDFKPEFQLKESKDKMDSFEFNKIFAALLVAGITAMLAGFIAEQLMHPHELEKNAVEIDAGIIGSAVAATAEGPEPIAALLASADIERGQKLSKACAACHSFDKGGVNKVGPNLWDVVGGKKGHMNDFAYSDALLAHGGLWSFDELNHFLWKPKKLIDGTKMNFIGIKKPEDRAALIAWLTSLSDKPMAFPVVEASDVAETAPAAESH